MPAIHQFVAGFANGDAISNEARVLRTLFRGWGFASEIFCETRRILPELRREAHDFSGHTAQAGDIALLHLSIGSPVNDHFARLPCRKAILYHNVTPAEYFEIINPQTATILARARPQIKALAGVAQVNLADSHFNARELADYGYRDVRVLPLVLDFDSYQSARDSAIMQRFGDGCTHILFVGRGAPNKRIDDALRVFGCYLKGVDSTARFIHVGSFGGSERYRLLLQAQVKAMGLPRDQVVFAGGVSQPALNAYYAVATLFLCMSEHEGFCIPLLESMWHGVPVVACEAGAVAETMGGAGILVAKRDFAAIAEMLGHVARNQGFRAALSAGQAERIGRYRARDLAGELRNHLAPLL